jgi:hypothetical protein
VAWLGAVACGGLADTTALEARPQVEPFGDCATNAECAEGECRCGLCAAACVAGGCGPGALRCVQPGEAIHDGLCLGRAEPALCLATCASGADCADGLECAGELCLPTDAAALLGSRSAPSLCAEGPVLWRSVEFDSQARIDGLAGCERVEGDVTIRTFAGADWTPLASLRAISGLLSMRPGSLESPGAPARLEALETLGSLRLVTLDLSGPALLPALRSLDAPSPAGLVPGEPYVDRWGLVNRSPFANVPGELYVERCEGLVDLRAFANVEGIDALRLLCSGSTPSRRWAASGSAARRWSI